MNKLISIPIVLLAFGCGERALYPTLPATVALHDNWTLAEVGTEATYRAKVPGVVHIDLLDNGVIEDPFWRNNELQLQWIEEKDWVYRTHIHTDEKLLQRTHIELVFEGLDTYATVLVNGEEVLRADNMFREWRKDIKKFLKPGKNELTVQFHAPLNVNRSLLESTGYELPAGCETVDTKVSPFTRKAAYHFGWDWGPRFVTCGIWRPVKLQAWDDARIANVQVTTTGLTEREADLKFIVSLAGNTTGMDLVIDGVKITAKQVNTHQLTIINPLLWWPNGSGNQHLYKRNIQLLQNGKLLDSLTVRFGIRTIELIEQPDSVGTSFYFKVNGHPLFMKGANYIPQDMFLPRVTHSQYRNLLIDAQEAGMNMLRVWGGGIYENDIFYDLCDSLGILIWQDFMFAGSMYPGDSAFVQNVQEEVTHNIQRLRNHPCLALWCGNNEMEVAWKNWGWQEKFGYSQADSAEIWNNYQKLFHQLIPNIIEKESPEIAYTPTSPLSNWGTPESFNRSSMHYWGVWHGGEPFESFEHNVGRFMVEYGFQSYPDMSTIRKFSDSEDRTLDSEVMKNRQKSYIGNGEIEKMITKYYHAPKDFEEFVMLSQQVQADALKMAIESHLSNKGHCMGTLFWQLNDCWPGPSWSTIDYYGNKKPAYFSVKELFSD